MNLSYRKMNCQRLIRIFAIVLSIVLLLAGPPDLLASDKSKKLTKDQGKKKDLPNASDLPKNREKEPHRLASGDVIEVRFFYNPELNDRVEIRPDGRISLQLISEVEVVGKTVEEVVKLL